MDLIEDKRKAFIADGIDEVEANKWANEKKLKNDEEISMDEIFTKKVRSAAAAGWWTLLIAYCILLLQWFVYWLIMNRQPEGMLCLWGKGVTWTEIRTIWLCAMVAYKLCF